LSLWKSWNLDEYKYIYWMVNKLHKVISHLLTSTCKHGKLQEMTTMSLLSKNDYSLSYIIYKDTPPLLFKNSNWTTFHETKPTCVFKTIGIRSMCLHTYRNSYLCSSGEGKYIVIASNKGCTPLFFRALPQSTGTAVWASVTLCIAVCSYKWK
jgi:hypothetical protein